MASIIALANQKGGTGKTTTTLNLGAALAESSHRVLLVDADPQGNLSVHLGIAIEELSHTLYDALLEETPLASVIIRDCPLGMHLVPANLDLAAAEVELMNEVSRENILREMIHPVLSGYDFILIDCPPNLGLLTLNALTAADRVIVPVQTEFLAMRGIKQLQTILRKVKRRTNPDLTLGFIATMYDRRTIHGRDVIEEVRSAFGEQVYQTVIRRTIKLADASVAGEPIVSYASRSAAAEDYRALAKEVLGDG